MCRRDFPRSYNCSLRKYAMHVCENFTERWGLPMVFSIKCKASTKHEQFSSSHGGGHSLMHLSKRHTRQLKTKQRDTSDIVYWVASKSFSSHLQRLRKYPILSGEKRYTSIRRYVRPIILWGEVGPILVPPNRYIDGFRIDASETAHGCCCWMLIFLRSERPYKFAAFWATSFSSPCTIVWTVLQPL